VTHERDPVLASIFEAADKNLEDPAFTDAIVDRMQRRRRRILMTRGVIIALLVLLEIALESPLQNSLGAVAEMLGQPLVPLDAGWIAFVLAPINSVAGLIAVVLMGISILYRRMHY
jgi:hypothetical protein